MPAVAARDWARWNGSTQADDGGAAGTFAAGPNCDAHYGPRLDFALDHCGVGLRAGLNNKPQNPAQREAAARAVVLLSGSPSSRSSLPAFPSSSSRVSSFALSSCPGPCSFPFPQMV